MVTFEQVADAYREYGEKMDKAAFFFRQNGSCRRYYELVGEADDAFDKYRELQEIYDSGGFED